MTEQEATKHFETLDENPSAIAAAVWGLDDATLRYKPSPEKWSIIEILAHLADVELVWGYRVREAISGNQAKFAPFDQDEWARGLQYQNTHAADALLLFQTNRQANLRLFRSLPVKELDRSGYHLKLQRNVSIAEIVERLVKHDKNHLGQIEALKEKAPRSTNPLETKT